MTRVRRPGEQHEITPEIAPDRTTRNLAESRWRFPQEDDTMKIPPQHVFLKMVMAIPRAMSRYSRRPLTNVFAPNVVNLEKETSEMV
jgi:hypothetical protein